MVHLHHFSKIKSQKESQKRRMQGFSYYFLHDDRRIRIWIHTSDWWIRIREAQKHVDPVDPDPDPEHCLKLLHLVSTSFSFWLIYYSSPQAMSLALDWGSWLSLTRTRIYLNGRVEVRIAREGARRSNLCCVRGSRALEPQNRVGIASRRGHHYVGAWPGPPTSSA